MTMPTIGRFVHYVSRGSLDGKFPPTCRAATVTEVGEDGVVGLCVFNPGGIFFHQLSDGGCAYDDGPQPAGGSWHWPERA